MVNTDGYFYRDAHIHYMGLPLIDLPSTNIRNHFYAAADFIDDAIKSGGNFIVHCGALEICEMDCLEINS